MYQVLEYSVQNIVAKSNPCTDNPGFPSFLPSPFSLLTRNGFSQVDFHYLGYQLAVWVLHTVGLVGRQGYPVDHHHETPREICGLSLKALTFVSDTVADTRCYWYIMHIEWILNGEKVIR